MERFALLAAGGADVLELALGLVVGLGDALDEAEGRLEEILHEGRGLFVAGVEDDGVGVLVGGGALPLLLGGGRGAGFADVELLLGAVLLLPVEDGLGVGVMADFAFHQSM